MPSPHVEAVIHKFEEFRKWLPEEFVPRQLCLILHDRDGYISYKGGELNVPFELEDAEGNVVPFQAMEAGLAHEFGHTVLDALLIKIDPTNAGVALLSRDVKAYGYLAFIGAAQRSQILLLNSDRALPRLPKTCVVDYERFNPSQSPIDMLR